MATFYNCLRPCFRFNFRHLGLIKSASSLCSSNASLINSIVPLGQVITSKGSSYLVQSSLLLQVKKFYSSDDNKGTEEELETFTGPVPRDKLQVRFSRSSGPGGQNVNKLNTKAEIRFNVQEADWLPVRVKERLKLLYKTKVNQNGELMITSQVYRTQHQNLQDAIRKLEEYLREASEVPEAPSEAKLTRIKKLKRQYDMKRLKEKKYNSLLKQSKKIDF